MYWTISTFFISGLIQLFFIFFASRHIEFSDFGTFSLFLSLTVFINYLLLQPAYSSFDRFYNVGLKQKNFLEKFNGLLIFILLISFLFVLFVYVFSNLFDFLIYFYLFIFLALSTTYSVFAKTSLMNLDRPAFFYVRLSEAFARFIFPILTFLIIQNFQGLILGLCLGFIISNFIGYIFNKNFYPFSFKFDVKLYKDMFLFSYPVIFLGFSSWALSWSNRFFIDVFFDLESVGLFSLLATSSGLIIFLSQIFTTYVNPKAFKMWETNKSETINFLLKSYKIYFLISFLIVFFIGIFSDFIVFELLGISENSFPNASNIFLLLLIASLLASFSVIFSLVFALEKKMMTFFKINLLGSLVNFFGNFFIGYFGLIFAATSYLIAYFFIVILILIFLILRKVPD